MRKPKIARRGKWLVVLPNVIDDSYTSEELKLREKAQNYCFKVNTEEANKRLASAMEWCLKNRAGSGGGGNYDYPIIRMRW